MRLSSRVIALAGLLLLLGVDPLDAMIVRKYPMKEVLKQSQYVFEGRVKAVDLQKQRFVVEVARELKGVSPWKEQFCVLTFEEVTRAYPPAMERPHRCLGPGPAFRSPAFPSGCV